jgi:hypothetical protein
MVSWPVHQLSKDVSSQEDAFTSWSSSSGLRRTYLLYHFRIILFKMVRYVLLRPLRPEQDGLRRVNRPFFFENVVSGVCIIEFSIKNARLVLPKLGSNHVVVSASQYISDYNLVLESL